MNKSAKSIMELRDYLKLTQEEFAQELGMSASSIGAYERGEREVSDELTHALHDKYGVEIPWIMTNSGNAFDTRLNLEELTALYVRVGDIKRREILEELRNYVRS